ncbi:hypothetical protein F4779DRAFT_640745 [Xylariaceae sp. FL0662B]|nr:hypothetical protein F4779DRAFT_640745 [Xylariaceae sp. FL0662B]
MPTDYARGVRRPGGTESNDSLKLKLLDALDSISAGEGKFASFGSIVPCDPEIFVHDIGRIDIPLPIAQARQLFTKSQQAAGVDGSEIMRNYCQLSPTQFEIRGAVWQTCLDNVLAHVAKELGITCPISAELHRMLLFKENPTFKSRLNASERPGVFGTLIIDLPSPHKGGNIVVTHRDNTTTLETSERNMSCAFWYSDVSHKILPIEFGYRWALDYNLKAGPYTERLTAERRLRGNLRLREALKLWLQEVSDGLRRASPLHYVLYNKYPDENMSYEGLKAPDRLRVKILQGICAEMGFDLFLTPIERKAVFSRYKLRNDLHRRHDYNVDDEGTRYLRLEEATDILYRSRNIFDLEGNAIVSRVTIDENAILQSDRFDGKPDQIEETRLLLTYTNRLSALVIVPCAGTVSFMTGCYAGRYGHVTRTIFDGLTRYFLNQCRRFPGKGLHLKQLHGFLRYIYHACRLEYAFPGDLVEVLQLTALGNEPEMVDLVFANNKQPVPVTFFTWVREAVDQSTSLPRNLEKVLLLALKSQSTLRQYYESISIVNGAVETTAELQEVVSKAIDEALKTKKFEMLYEEDGRAIFDLAYYHRDFDYLKAAVVPIVEKRSSSTAFVLGFLKALEQSMKFKQIPERKAMPIYKNVSRAALQAMSLDSLSGLDASQRTMTNFFLSNGRTLNPRMNYVTYRSMIRWISYLTSVSALREMLADKIRNEAIYISGEEFNELWIPLLQGLLATIGEHEISASKRYWAQIYQSLLKAYLLNYVGNPPPKRTSLKEYNEDLDDWVSMRLWAEYNLEAFDQEKLRAVLGDQYVNITTMKLIKAHEVDPTPSETTPSSSSRSPFANVPRNPAMPGSAAMASFSTPAPSTGREPVEFGVNRGSASRNRVSSSWRGPTQDSDWYKSRSPRRSMVGAPSGSKSASTPLRRNSTKLPHPVAGSKRKFVEIIDLTGDD